MKKYIAFVGVVGLLAVLGLQGIKKDSKQLDENKFPGERGYSVYPIPLKDIANINFAGEPVPVHLTDIKERLERELLVNTYWQSNGMLLLKRMNRFFPIIEPILEKNNIPDDFKYLAVIESGLTNVVSPAGATGFWQFLKGTGKEYDLQIDDEIDERYHLKKATEAACKYLTNNYGLFESWTLAAAAYNGGHNGLKKYLEQQQVGSYYDLLLGEETGRYVFRIIALKYIHQNQDKFGFRLNPEDFYPSYETTYLKVDTAVEDFAVFAKDHGINYKILKLLNPWLRKPYLKNGGQKSYYLEIPSGKKAMLQPYNNKVLTFDEE